MKKRRLKQLASMLDGCLERLEQITTAEASSNRGVVVGNLRCPSRLRRDLRRSRKRGKLNEKALYDVISAICEIIIRRFLT